jgi:arylsulfatase A-like enzyme
MNVVLLVSDSLRARNTSLLGYRRETTPFLEKLAKDSVVYRNAIAPSIWSLPSHASLFTGLYPQEHRVYTMNSRLQSSDTIWHSLGRRGYATAVFSRNVFVTSDQYGLTDGVDHVDKECTRFEYPFAGLRPNEFDATGSALSKEVAYALSSLRSRSTVGSLFNGISQYLSNRDAAPELLRRRQINPARDHVDRLLNWIDSVDSKWAACINFMSTHHDYEPIPEYNLWGLADDIEAQTELGGQIWPFYSGMLPWSKKEALVDLYDGTIRQVDQAVKYLYEQLDERDELEETVIVFTSDHGEGFGEYSQVRPDIRLAAHIMGIDDPLLHVPLLVHKPQSRSKLVDQPVSLTGIAEWIKEGHPETDITDVLRETKAVAAADIGGLLKYDIDGDIREPEYDVDLSRFDGLAQAGYKHRDGKVVKHAVWGDAKLESPIEDEMEAMWSQFQDQGVSGIGTVDEETEQRLANLGYL